MPGTCRRFIPTKGSLNSSFFTSAAKTVEGTLVVNHPRGRNLTVERTSPPCVTLLEDCRSHPLCNWNWVGAACPRLSFASSALARSPCGKGSHAASIFAVEQTAAAAGPRYFKSDRLETPTMFIAFLLSPFSPHSTDLWIIKQRICLLYTSDAADEED